MPVYRSRTTTHGRNMAGARALWRATGMKDGDFEKPIIAISNSFTQFVPGHVHLKDLGQLVAREIERAGGVAKEFNTIAVDDGIAMGHSGMLYSLPSRDLIADSVEYMVNAHCADALVCISMNLIEIDRQLLVALDDLPDDVGHHFFVRGAQAEVRALAVLEPQELAAVELPAPALLPQLARLHGGHQQLLAAVLLQFFAHDRLELADAAQRQRQVVVDAGGHFLDHAGTHHELLADHVRIARRLAVGLEKEL